MTKSTNVEVIVDRMIDYMININDNHYKTEIASRCVELAEQFAPTNHWFIQTMNKVFQYAGDIVNPKVAHNLMRLIAEGFGEDDDTADSQLRSSAVESYLQIMGEPKLPSAFFQVICWVLGEYGTADGKHSGSYISGKLCDVAEAHPSEYTIKAYTITALMKICSFEKAAGRKMGMLPECQSLIEELSASHSTDLQQRAYELRAFIVLDGNDIQNIMPFDASCEDIEIDKSLSFLNGYVQKSLEDGAQPYIPEHERNGSLNINNSKNHDTTNSLKFEAYEVPKPVIPRLPPKVFSSTQLVHIPDLSYQKEVHRSPSVGSLDTGSTQLKLRLDGVQKKWGQPNFSDSDSHRTTGNGITKAKSVDLSRMPPEEISEEKQKLAASLYGRPSSRAEKKQCIGQTKASKAPRHARYHTSQVVHAPPDLLDLGTPTSGPSGSSSTVDPFKQLEGLIDPTQNSSTSGQTQNVDGSSLSHVSVELMCIT